MEIKETPVPGKKEVEIALFGRLDHVTFSELADFNVEHHYQDTLIILDLKELEYVSSAGLRTILLMQKNSASNNNHIIAKHLNPNVREVFHITGFDRIIEIEEDKPDLDIDGMEIVGRGLCGTCYKVSDDTILKLYSEGTDPDMIEKEKTYAREALVLGIPTAISLEMVTVGKRQGILFELLSAKSVKSIMEKDPSKVESYAKRLADLAKTVHSAIGNPEVLPDCESSQKILIAKSTYIRDDLKIKALKLLDTLPKPTHCIHGDFHPGNIMEDQNGELMFIDMGDFALGSPYQDLAMVYSFFRRVTPHDFEGKVTGLKTEDRLRFYKAFVDCYFGNPSDERLEEIEREMLKVLIIRHFFYIDNFPATREDNIAFVTDYLESIDI